VFLGLRTEGSAVEPACQQLAQRGIVIESFHHVLSEEFDRPDVLKPACFYYGVKGAWGKIGVTLLLLTSVISELS
jgi:hypothetical protein